MGIYRNDINKSGQMSVESGSVFASNNYTAGPIAATRQGGAG